MALRCPGLRSLGVWGFGRHLQGSLYYIMSVRPSYGFRPGGGRRGTRRSGTGTERPGTGRPGTLETRVQVFVLGCRVASWDATVPKTPERRRTTGGRGL